MAALCLASFAEEVQYWMSWRSRQSGECTFKKYDMGDGEIEIGKFQFWSCLYNIPLLGRPDEFTGSRTLPPLDNCPRTTALWTIDPGQFPPRTIAPWTIST